MTGSPHQRLAFPAACLAFAQHLLLVLLALARNQHQKLLGGFLFTVAGIVQGLGGTGLGAERLPVLRQGRAVGGGGRRLDSARHTNRGSRASRPGPTSWPPSPRM